jgi:hypothetical protein
MRGNQGQSNEGEDIKAKWAKKLGNFFKNLDFKQYNVMEWFNFKKRETTIILKEMAK